MTRGRYYLETDTTENHDLSSAHLVGTYTADAERLILVQVFLDTVAGNGDYVFFCKLQIAGAGSDYFIIPKTTAAAASGETAIAAQSGMVAVSNTDILTVYVDCLAGDTSVDCYVRFYEVTALQPTTADRALDVSTGGEAGVDWANVGSPTTTVGLSATTISWNAAWDAEVQSEAADALVAYDPPTNAEMEARTLVAASYFDAAADAVANVTTVGTVTNPVTAGTVSDKTGYAVTTTEHINIADALLKRDLSAVTGEAARSPLNALRFLRNKWAVITGTLHVKKEDDATDAWTATLSSDAAADPITGSDPD